MGPTTHLRRGLGTLCVAAALLSSSSAAAQWATQRRQDRAAGTLEGGAGLFHVRSVTHGPRFELRLGTSLEYFNHKQFLVQDWPNCGNICPDERNERIRGAVTFGATLWRYLEVFGAVYFSRNTNYRNHLEPTDEPEHQTIAGDFSLGLKAFFPVEPKKALVMGALLSMKAHTGLGDIQNQPRATTVSVAYLLSFRADRINPFVPFRLHFNLGYIHDPSHRVLGDTQEEWTPQAWDPSEAHHRFLVQQFALALNTARFNLALGFEFPVRFWGGLLDPILELQMDIHIGDPNAVLLAWPEYNPVDDDSHLRSRVASRMVTGVRIRPVAGLALDLGIDIRLRRRGLGYGPPRPPWNVFLQLGYVLPVGRATGNLPPPDPDRVSLGTGDPGDPHRGCVAPPLQ